MIVFKIILEFEAPTDLLRGDSRTSQTSSIKGRDALPEKNRNNL